MTNQENGKLHDFDLSNEIFNAVAVYFGSGLLFGFLIYIITAIMGRNTGVGAFIICILIFGGVGIAYLFKLHKFDKDFGLRQDNKYSIDKIKEYFGAPINILEDKDCVYYTFYENTPLVFNKIHTFTTDKKGIVIKHELSFLGNNKKD